MHEADVPPVLAAHLDQSLLRGADRGVGRLARHRGLGQELRLEVLDSVGVVVGHDALGPFAAGVLALPGGSCLEETFVPTFETPAHRPVPPGLRIKGLRVAPGSTS
ncbi:hypothetical protein [Streptomyces sp. NPDC021212]|uniref:hypothetical protein n=1 Tax=Streptomyces sp. NPDC021212 TaxID=3365118 RepID=UPI0037AD016B